MNLIEKLAFTLQIHRIEKADFCRIFENTEKITFKDLQNTFVKDPFKFDLESSEKISKFLFGLTNLSDFVLISEIQAKFEKYSENWKTFSQDDEDMLDSELKEFVSKHSLSFYEKSLENDEKKQGIIEWKDFVDILSSFKIHFSEKLLNYCKLLFFSFSLKVNIIPYDSFIKSYWFTNDSIQSKPQEAKIVKNYLKKIVQKLTENNKKASEVFKFDEKRLVSFGNFVKAMNLLGIEEFEIEDTNLVLQYLQSEDSEKICFSIDEFEDVLMSCENEDSVETKNIQSPSFRSNYQYSEDYESEYSDDCDD